MIEFEEVIKESKAFKIIEQDALQNKIAHSYMIISEDKQTLNSFLTIMLQTIYCTTHTACGHCEYCQKIQHKNNPNTYWLANDTAIKVDDVKDLILDTYIAPVENNYKTYVIENAELMNEASQNKLLKTIEEPNKGVIIILGVNHEQAMLQTIKSRTKKIFLNVWNNETIKKELAKIDTNEQNIALATKFCKGNITKAKSLLVDQKFQELYHSMLDMLENYTSTALLSKYIKCFGQEKEDIQYAVTLLEGIVSDLIYDNLNGVENNLTSKYNIRTLANINDLLIDTSKRLASNCNPQAVATDFLLKLAEIRYLLT